MKTKKKSISILIICILFLVFSCGRGNNSVDNSIIAGKWQMFGEVFSAEYYVLTFCDVADSCVFRSWIEFRADGTFTDLDMCAEWIFSGVWKIEENKLTLVENNGYCLLYGDYVESNRYRVFIIVSVSKNELVILNENGYTLKIRRIKPSAFVTYSQSAQQQPPNAVQTTQDPILTTPTRQAVESSNRIKFILFNYFI